MSSIESVTCEQSEGEHIHFSMVRWSVILVGLVYFSIAGSISQQMRLINLGTRDELCHADAGRWQDNEHSDDVA